MAPTTQISKGQYILFEGEPHVVVEKEFVSPGKGSAFTRVKMNNLITGRQTQFTFKSGEKVEEIDVFTSNYQYLYNDTNNYYFMDNKTFEQISLSKDKIGEFEQLIKEGEEYMIVVYEGKPIAFKAPLKIVREVTEAGEGVKGDTATNATKKAKTETGYELDVPLFISKGDKIAINTETGKYVERVT